MRFVVAKELAASSGLSPETLRRWGDEGSILMRDLSPDRVRRRTLRFGVDDDGFPVKVSPPVERPRRTGRSARETPRDRPGRSRRTGSSTSAASSDHARQRQRADGRGRSRRAA